MRNLIHALQDMQVRAAKLNNMREPLSIVIVTVKEIAGGDRKVQ